MARIFNNTGEFPNEFFNRVLSWEYKRCKTSKSRRLDRLHVTHSTVLYTVQQCKRQKGNVARLALCPEKEWPKIATHGQYMIHGVQHVYALSHLEVAIFATVFAAHVCFRDGDGARSKACDALLATRNNPALVQSWLKRTKRSVKKPEKSREEIRLDAARTARDNWMRKLMLATTKLSKYEKQVRAAEKKLEQKRQEELAKARGVSKRARKIEV